jgi:phosphatidylserine decarboxylase
VSGRWFVALQHLLPQHLLSRLVGRLARSRLLARPLIRAFVAGYKPDMRDALEAEPLAYSTFNAFFTRALRPGSRPMPADPAALASPVDGTISMGGRIEDGRLLQAKGQWYQLADLLGGEPSLAARFAAGSFLTIYLAPYNYHRIHMPCAGTLTGAWFVPGRLFSVNRLTAARVPGLFARNERVICGFDSERVPFAVILIGALNVGSMDTVWHGPVAPARQRVVTPLVPRAALAPLRRQRGDELGRFNMGSTVILLFPRDGATLDAALAPGHLLRVGATIGRMGG